MKPHSLYIGRVWMFSGHYSEKSLALYSCRGIFVAVQLVVLSPGGVIIYYELEIENLRNGALL